MNVHSNTADKSKKRILFVCLGNICRSPAAQGIMQDIVNRNHAGDRWEIDSAGTGRWHIGQLPDRRMRVHGRTRGYNFDHICRQVSEEDFSRFDLIVGMDAMNMEDLKQLAPSPEAVKKLVPMSRFMPPNCGYDYIPDPYYEGSQGFELVLDLLEQSCQNIFDTIEERKK